MRTMIPRALLHLAFVTQRLALFFPLWLACTVSEAGSIIQFGGVPVELTISQVSERTVHLQLSPLDQRDQPPTDSTSAVFVAFSANEKLRVRELAGENELRVGQFRLTIQPQPLTIALRRADGTLVQELAFDSEGASNSIAFQTLAPL